MIAIGRLLQLTQLNNSLRVRIIPCIFLPDRIDTVIEPVLLKHSQHLMHTHKIGQIHHVDKWQVCLRLLTTTQAEWLKALPSIRCQHIIAELVLECLPEQVSVEFKLILLEGYNFFNCRILDEWFKGQLVAVQ